LITENSTESDPSQVFFNSGPSTIEKYISLVAITEFGCRDSVMKPAGIFPGVEVDFTASNGAAVTLWMLIFPVLQ